MPLIKSSSDDAFGKNVEAERDAGKPMDQALAIAYDIKRRNRAGGGAVHIGSINSAVGGRTDHHPMDVPDGAYVLRADHVSSLGEGNTENGFAILDTMLGGPFEVNTMDNKTVPINAAGGEYVIPPEVVREIGGGDLKFGHEILDSWMEHTRKSYIKTLSSLPGPAK